MSEDPERVKYNNMSYFWRKYIILYINSVRDIFVDPSFHISNYPAKHNELKPILEKNSYFHALVLTIFVCKKVSFVDKTILWKN